MRRKPWPAVPVLVLGTMLAVPVLAAQLQAEAVHLTDLARVADTVVLTRCDTGASAWTGDPPIIVTRHQCRVARVFRGQPAEAVTVQVLGGRVGDVSMAASAGGALTADADMVLLLQRSEFGPYYVITGGASGALVVSGGPAHPAVAGMTLDEFARLVRP